MSMPEGQRVVFIHGAQGSQSVWQPVVDELASLASDIFPDCIDLPGHGIRAAQQPCLDIGSMANWLGTNSLVTAMVSKKAHVVGHSMGSLVALELARSFPQHIASISLLGSAVPMPVSPSLLAQAHSDPDGAIALIAKWSHAPAHGARLTSGGMSLRDHSVAAMKQQPAATLANDLCACADYHGDETVRSIACPVLVVCGSADRMTSPESATAIANMIPNAHLEVLQDVGHAMMQEAPQQLANLLLDFVRRNS